MSKPCHLVPFFTAACAALQLFKLKCSLSATHELNSNFNSPSLYSFNLQALALLFAATIASVSGE
ncbi:MAG: hypothetical protein IJV31_02320 [Clostridia bacterium]|nr:hypothetical protein [Bacilli bacterium]MBQ9657586.1 hypothetical protein [Clostridia bacterium]